MNKHHNWPMLMEVSYFHMELIMVEIESCFADTSDEGLRVNVDPKRIS